MKDNYKTEINRNHSFGKLRRKVRKEIQKDNNEPDYQNIKPKEINYYNYKSKYNTIENINPLHSKYNNIYSSYKLKTKNKSNINNYNTNYNEEFIENNKEQNYSKKIGKIMRPSKSALFPKKCSHNEDLCDDYYLCQNCINERLIEEKKKLNNELNYNNNIPVLFEDKNKYYTEKIIKEKLNNRQKKIIEAYHTLEKCQELNTKEKLIKENENAPNPLYKYQHNYSYENFRAKYAQKQKYIKDNYNKYLNKERPEITKYFNNYINNPNYKAKEYGEYKPKIIDVENYKKDLSEQINYKKNKKMKEIEEDKMNEYKGYLTEMKKIEKEREEKALKKQKIKDELIKGNLDLINAKIEKREKLLKEDLKYKEYFEKEKIEYKNDLLNEQFKKDKINRDFISENQKSINRIKRKKEEQKLEKNNYRYIDYTFEPPKEAIDKCHACNKIYPRKLLTKNSSVFGYKKNNE